MPAHCESDMAEVPESVNMSTKTASEGILKRLYPPSLRRRLRSSRDNSSIFSTTLIRQGSGSGLLIESPPIGCRLRERQRKKIKTTGARRLLESIYGRCCDHSVAPSSKRDKGEARNRRMKIAENAVFQIIEKSDSARSAGRAGAAFGYTIPGPCPPP